MSDLPRIAIIGAGRLGLRHAESVYKCGRPARIVVVDQSTAAIDRLRTHLQGLPIAHAAPEVEYVSDLKDLPKHLDVTIVATTSDARLGVVEGLLSHSRPRYMVMEKVLFQRVADYRRCDELLRHAKVMAFVNCPRRLYSIYKSLKTLIADHRVRHIGVLGGEWGLGCNSVHFADLFQFLTGASVAGYAANLDPDVLDSKRPGFVEFTGRLLGRSGSVTIEMTAVRHVLPRIFVTVLAENLSCTIDEEAGVARICKPDGRDETIQFEVPRQSDLTGVLAHMLVEEGRCELASYQDSMTSHLPLIETFLSASRSRLDPSTDFVAIT